MTWRLQWATSSSASSGSPSEAAAAGVSDIRRQKNLTSRWRLARATARSCNSREDSASSSSKVVTKERLTGRGCRPPGAPPLYPRARRAEQKTLGERAAELAQAHGLFLALHALGDRV